MRADDERGARVDGRAGLLALGLARLQRPLHAEVQQGDHEVGSAPGGSDLLGHRGDVEPGDARPVVPCGPRARVVAAALDGHGHVREERDRQALALNRGGGVRRRPVRSCAGAEDARLGEERPRLREGLRAEVEGVVVGERDEVDARECERLHGDGRGAEGVGLGRGRAGHADGALEVGHGDIGPGEDVAHAGEGHLRALRLQPDGHAAPEHHVADGCQHHACGRRGGRGWRRGRGAWGGRCGRGLGGGDGGGGRRGSGGAGVRRDRGGWLGGGLRVALRDAPAQGNRRASHRRQQERARPTAASSVRCQAVPRASCSHSARRR